MSLPELADAGAIYAYSFTLEVSMPAKAIAAEHWYWHRTTVENIFRSSKICAARRRQGYGPLSRSSHTSLPHHSSESPEANYSYKLGEHETRGAARHSCIKQVA